MRIIRKTAKKTFNNIRKPIIRKAAKKNFSRDVNEIWDAIVENGIATEDECSLVTDINGYSERSLNDIIYARTGYHDIEQYLGESDDFACGSKSKKFADEKQLDKFYNKHLTREEAIEAVGIDKVEEVERENCEYRGQSDVYEEEYWTSDVDIDNDGHFLRIVYTVPKEAFYREDGEAIEDLGELDWEGYIDYYELY